MWFSIVIPAVVELGLHLNVIRVVAAVEPLPVLALVRLLVCRTCNGFGDILSFENSTDEISESAGFSSDAATIFLLFIYNEAKKQKR